MSKLVLIIVLKFGFNLSRHYRIEICISLHINVLHLWSILRLHVDLKFRVDMHGWGGGMEVFMKGNKEKSVAGVLNNHPFSNIDTDQH